MQREPRITYQGVVWYKNLQIQVAHNKLERSDSLKDKNTVYITKSGTHFQVYCATKMLFKFYE